MRQILIGGSILALLLALPVAAQSAPLRVVTYHFNIDEHGFMSSTSISTSGDTALGGMTMTGGRSGTITVNVLSATKDGGLVVEAHEQVDRADHPMQAVRCAVYENPDNVVCDQNLEQAGAVTEEIDSLLSYFGRGFYDTSRLDTNNHWQTVQPLNDGKASRTTDFTVTGADGNVVTMNVKRVTRTGNGVTTMAGTLIYDSGMTIPKSGHLVTDSNEGGELGGSLFDFKLLSDSFAKH